MFVTISVIVVFQYKYCSGFTYKMFTGNCIVTQFFFCNLTLRSNTYWKMFIHIHDIHITWFVFFPRLKFMLGFNTYVNIFFFLRMFNYISFVGLLNGHPGVFLCCEIYTVVRVDSSHCLRIKFIYSIGRKSAFINVDGGITYEDSHL